MAARPEWFEEMDWKRLNDQFAGVGFKETPESLKEIVEVSFENINIVHIKDSFLDVVITLRDYFDAIMVAKLDHWDKDPTVEVTDLPQDLREKFAQADMKLQKYWPPFAANYLELKNQLFTEYRKRLIELSEKIAVLQSQLDKTNIEVGEGEAANANLLKEIETIKVEIEKLKAEKAKLEQALVEAKNAPLAVKTSDAEFEALKAKNAELEDELAKAQQKLAVKPAGDVPPYAPPMPKKPEPKKNDDHGSGGHGGHDDHGHGDKKKSAVKWWLLIPIALFGGLLLGYMWGRSSTGYEIADLEAQIAGKTARIADLEKANKTLRGAEVFIGDVAFVDGRTSKVRLLCPHDKPSFYYSYPEKGEPGFGRHAVIFGCQEVEK